MRFFIIFFVFYFSLIGKSFGYIDPGTGSIILQAILGFIAAAIATLSFYWDKFKMLICKLFKKKQKNEND